MRRRPILVLPILLSILGLLPASGFAQPVLIDFSTLPDGSEPRNYSVVGDAYGSLGVTFGTLEVEDRGPPSFRLRISSIALVGDFSRAPDRDVGFHVLATFDEPVSYVSYDTFTAAPSEFTLIAHALDAAGDLIGTVETERSFGMLKGRYTLENVGPIYAVWWSSNQPFVALSSIGNLEFEFIDQLEVVDIDIKPRSDRNPINLKSRGKIPVAILGSETLDVAEIDQTTLAFGPDGAMPAHAHGGRFKDVNEDGIMDLVSHYRTDETGIAFGDTEACISGERLDGGEFEGCDEIWARLHARPHRHPSRR
jgi:hypothetical protein